MLLQPVVDVIDADPELAGRLSGPLREGRVTVRTWRDVDVFLGGGPLPDSGCVVLRTSEPGLEALDPFLRLKAARVHQPVIIASRYGSSRLAVASFKLKAFDFFYDPIETGLLVASILEALEADRHLPTLPVDRRPALLRHPAVNRLGCPPALVRRVCAVAPG